MRSAASILIAAFSLCLVSTCGVDHRDHRKDDLSKTVSTNLPPSPVRENPNAELLPEELVLPPVDQKEEPAALALKDVDSPEKLLSAARKALEEKRYMDAASIADVASLLSPNEPEIFEVRGLALRGSGDTQGAQEDFRKCCALGRRSCCETVP